MRFAGQAGTTKGDLTQRPSVEVRAASTACAFDANLPPEESERRVPGSAGQLLKHVLGLVGRRRVESLQAQHPEFARLETSVVAALLDCDRETVVVNRLDPVTVLARTHQVQAPRGRPCFLEMVARVELPCIGLAGTAYDFLRLPPEGLFRSHR